MNKSINAIIWPDSPAGTINLYLAFLIKVCDELNIIFRADNNDPVALVKAYLQGKVGLPSLNDAAVRWWNIADVGENRDFSDPEIAKARIAICLLSPKEPFKQEAGEHLAWFIELLGLAGFDSHKVIALYADYFAFSPHSRNVISSQ